MYDIISQYYLLIKALHLISIICWMAGMLYLPRLFVYHADARQGSDLDHTFQIMERRLLKLIINPSMLASFIFGSLLIYIIGFNVGYWLHMKLLCVGCLVIIHVMLAKYRKDFVKGKNKRSSHYYRIINEVPSVAMVVIILLAIIKPF